MFVGAIAIAFEARNAFLQSILFTRWAGEVTFSVGSGPTNEIHFPKGGPQDQRLGYSRLPTFIDSLKTRGFSVARQASWSPELSEFTATHGYGLYHEKEVSGLSLLDRNGAPLYKAKYPQRLFENFEDIPPLIVNTLLFIEDRELLDGNRPRQNPAVNWHRFALATAGQIGGLIDPSLRQGGASTLATQIEKFRHYPDGLTRTADDKLRQMAAAAMRAYLDGPDTIKARQGIVATYINSTPLSSRPGYGEIIGVGDGLWAWYGTDISEAKRVLSDPSPANLARKAEIYKQVLSLLLAQQRPSYYLLESRAALAYRVDQYLIPLANGGVIDEAMHDAVLRAKLRFVDLPPAPAAFSFVERKAAGAIRNELLGLLGASNLYDLDRLDVSVNTTFDSGAQQSVSDVLARLDKPAEVKALGMTGPSLLGSEDPSKVKYSVVLYERGADRNFVRVHADSLDQPFDLNSGAKLILGSTAKLRTLVTYLDIIERLHERYVQTPARDLQRIAVAKDSDPLTRWVTGYLANSKTRDLQPMLDAAMQRHYSASPGERFFTGGGVHTFHNFQRSDDRRSPTVEEALVHSINLSFVRIMRDVRDFYIAEEERTAAESSGRSDVRATYLARFADQEGRTFLNQFYGDLRDKTPDQVLSSLAGRTRNVPRRLAIVYRSLRPDASVSEFRTFLAKYLPKTTLTDKTVNSLYAAYGIDKYSLVDRAYLANLHPLQLWLGAYLQDHPGASRGEVTTASADERQESYGWLFKTRSERKQDVRIRILREQDAFRRIHADWRKQGYPFAFLVPSLATAIGSSGDRPDALAQLMGIITNDGVELPTVKIEQMTFAAGTPYETQMGTNPEASKRVLSTEVASTIRRALTDVVAEGTGVRFRGAYHAADGKPLIVGGKTGTGDNRFETFRAGQQLASSRVVDRTATFVFFLGDRFYGTVTAYVPGAVAAKYHFTSALAVQLLKSLTPQLQPLIDGKGEVPVAGASRTVEIEHPVVPAAFQKASAPAR